MITAERILAMVACGLEAPLLREAEPLDCPSHPSWRPRSCGHDLQAAAIRLATTNQSDRGCGWVWHVSVDHIYGGDTIAQRGGFETEAEAQAAAVEWTRDYCRAALAALANATQPS